MMEHCQVVVHGRISNMHEKKTKRVSTRIHTRKIDRAVAKYRMKKTGRTHIMSRKRNRYGTKKHPTHGGTVTNEHYSYFSQTWREWSK